MSIYVGNLSYEVTEDDLKAVFAMTDEKEEDAAIEALDEAEWMGRALKVNKAKPRESSDSFGGGRGGFKGGGGRPSVGGGGRRY